VIHPHYSLQIAQLLRGQRVCLSGTTTHLKHTVDQKIASIERKQKADASAVSSLRTKVLIEGDEMRDTLRTLGQELYNSIDAMEDRVDEVSHMPPARSRAQSLCPFFCAFRRVHHIVLVVAK
jgi:hypothetical protein